MKLRTEIASISAPFQINYSHPIFSIGSCFSENIGNKLTEYKFPILNNPFGTLFNPLSIAKLLQLSLDKDALAVFFKQGQQRFIQRQGIWFHYDLHSDFSAQSQQELQAKIETQITEATRFLQKTDILIITWGTAWIYELQSDKKFVANCHKVPAKHFEKKLLSVEAITKSYQKLFKTLWQTRPDLKVILTLSPVRHIKDTLPLNSVSKSILRLASHQLSEENEKVFYFQSYEILMDDLRDYRFYKDDLLHPNQTAINYIWEHFSNTFFDAKTQDLLQEWQKIKKALAHRSFHPESEAHQSFLRKTLTELEKVQKQLFVEEEIKHILKQII